MRGVNGGCFTRSWPAAGLPNRVGERLWLNPTIASSQALFKLAVDLGKDWFWFRLDLFGPSRKDRVGRSHLDPGLGVGGQRQHLAVLGGQIQGSSRVST